MNKLYNIRKINVLEALSQDTQIVCPKVYECNEVSPALIKHILVPFDQSQMSHRAFELSLDLAKKYNARIHILTVMHSGVLSSSFLDMNNHQKIIESGKIRQLEQSFKLLDGVSKKMGVKISTDMIVSGNISDSILSFCAQYRINLIVMGTRARNSSKRFLIGSVAVDVIQKAACPVILVK